jgi:diguanylate cyclase (GGDEF)-like protein
MKFYGWKFACIIALPLAAASLAIYLLTFDLLDRVSTGANRADHERTRQVVLSALAATKAQLADFALDNAYWEDAARQAYGEMDKPWIFDTWGVLTEEGDNYNAVLMIDTERIVPMIGYKDGREFNPVLADYFKQGFPALLDSLLRDFSSHEPSASFIDTADGLAVAAIAPIMSPTSSLHASASRPRYLMFIRYLTPELLAHVGDQYVVSKLALERNGGGSDEPCIADLENKPLARVTWADALPGDDVRKTVRPKAMAALGFLALVMAGIWLLCWVLFGKMASRETQARRAALHDSLTGLPNRLALQLEMERLCAVKRQSVALAFADLDGFKDVNDTYDHLAGDQLIRAVAMGMQQIMTGQTFLARAGGDEFVAVFVGDDAAHRAATFAQAVITMLKEPFDLEGRFATVGASLGISSNEEEWVPAAELMRRADVAMYEAKHGGKNRVCRYAPSIDAERQANMRIASELRAIIAARSIELAYQPIVEAATRRIVGVEALARWPRSAGFSCAPDKFIAVAETSGLIDELGEAILAKACMDAKAWPGIRLNVNISPVQMRNPSFVARSLGVIKWSGIDANRVEFEVTEGILVDDLDKARLQLGQLREAGIEIALDDFGSGHSSIGYLKTLEFDRIKIDRSIISKVLSSTREQSIVQGTVLMASGMAASVTAEGVESEDQLQLLRLVGCNELQGYLLHKPMAAHEVTRLLQTAAEQLASESFIKPRL